jgi:LPS O-antigen subunit length determinant protein (WzzB/FepE family)
MQNQDNAIHAYDDEIDLFELMQKILQRWKMIAGITIVVTIIAAIVAYTLPKQYMAQATYEIFTTTTTLLFEPTTIKEYIDSAIKFKKEIYNFEVNINLNKDNKRYISFEVFGGSPQEAANNLRQVTDNLLINGFKEKIADAQIILKQKVQSIDETLGLYKKGGYIILEPASISNLMQEKQLILQWLEKPYIVKQVSIIEIPQKPVKPKKILIIAVAFISGLFISIFVALFVDAYNSWKISRKIEV